ncbi:hypothetical protein [Caballeronia zhejiangensis]|uniref:hypothetical protein n=1 Tax=Caballeronia zhejiangensis TaxID=871203 RepID=UPI001F51D044|nr:hypothetical protein [Caballeronia zhejiangensis]MCI1046943.1 hypothetical protein [Caballeronia zhejiangensis]
MNTMTKRYRFDESGHLIDKDGKVYIYVFKLIPNEEDVPLYKEVRDWCHASCPAASCRYKDQTYLMFNDASDQWDVAPFEYQHAREIVVVTEDEYEALAFTLTYGGAQ